MQQSWEKFTTTNYLKIFSTNILTIKLHTLLFKISTIDFGTFRKKKKGLIALGNLYRKGVLT